jgi:hypothetical protein
MNNNAVPGDGKKAFLVPIYKGVDRSVVGNYRPVTLTSVVCKQLEHVLAGYLRHVWDTSDCGYMRVSMVLYLGTHAKVK